jgi:putative sigma-54 modulation protein
MDIITTARRFEITPELRDHAERRLSKLDRYLDQILEAHLVLDQQKHRQIAELTVRANGAEMISREETPDMITSIDRVVDRIERQIKKHNARLKDRKARRPVAAATPVEEEELSDVESQDEWGVIVVRGRQWHPESVSVEEAIGILRESDEDFLLFRNSRTGKVGLVHTRPDGNFGFVEESD